nr:MAG TPA: hypothetical protein [Caudoviricetes sp.]
MNSVTQKRKGLDSEESSPQTAYSNPLLNHRVTTIL